MSRSTCRWTRCVFSLTPLALAAVVAVAVAGSAPARAQGQGQAQAQGDDHAPPDADEGAIRGDVPGDAFEQAPADDEALPEPAAPTDEGAERVEDDIARTVDDTVITPRLASWRADARAAAVDAHSRWGEPDDATGTSFVWRDVGPYARVVITNRALPVEHVVRYTVPADQLDELARFDNAVTVDHTARTITVRSANAPLGVVLLNLVDDVVRDRATVAAARDTWDRARRAVARGETPQLAQGLRFEPEPRAVGR